MTKEQIIQKVTAILDGKGYYNAKPDDRFVDDMGLDSLDRVEVIMEAEMEFGIEIPDEESDKLLTVESVANYIEAVLAAGK